MVYRKNLVLTIEWIYHIVLVIKYFLLKGSSWTIKSSFREVIFSGFIGNVTLLARPLLQNGKGLFVFMRPLPG
jgi:hypothetical protein